MEQAFWLTPSELRSVAPFAGHCKCRYGKGFRKFVRTLVGDRGTTPDSWAFVVAAGRSRAGVRCAWGDRHGCFLSDGEKLERILPVQVAMQFFGRVKCLPFWDCSEFGIIPASLLHGGICIGFCSLPGNAFAGFSVCWACRKAKLIRDRSNGGVAIAALVPGKAFAFSRSKFCQNEKFDVPFSDTVGGLFWLLGRKWS